MSSTTTEALATTMDEPLARLVAFEPAPFPVLSVYLNTQPDQHTRTPDRTPYLHREFKALARTWAPGTPERHSFDRDVERIVAYAAGQIDAAASGVALFACWSAQEFFEAIPAVRKVHRVKVGGWSQAPIDRLTRIVREDNANHIILAGDRVVIPLLQEQLPQEMVPWWK
jgi:hypothetical protein